MTTSARAEPWRSLPADVADAIAPELPGITEDILDSIAAEVPEYARPLEGSCGRGVRTGVTEALAQFVELIRDPDRGREQGREVYRALGRGELRQGRTLDALQAAYRVGARVAWRRIARAAREAPVDPEVLSALAEAIFAYIAERAADAAGVPTELVMAEDRLAEVLVSENRVLIERIAERRLRALGTLSPAARTRLEKTALAYVQQHGNAAAMARALHVHPQTVRYRLSRLRKLLGGSLDDPDGRF